MACEKKSWDEPTLIVLTRGRREEAVLTSCKHTDDGSGMNVEAGYCGNLLSGCSICMGLSSS